MKTLKMSMWGAALGSRDLGEKVRQELLEKMESNSQPIMISFEGILVISSSFADECFGKLITAIGIKQFKECFRISDLVDRNLKMILNTAVNKRISKDKVNS